MDNLNNGGHIFTFIWIFALSSLGAITAYLKKKRDNGDTFSFFHLLGDILISFFLGAITYFLCKGAGINDFFTAGFVGVVSHLGTRALVLIDVLVPTLRDTIKIVVPGVICKFFNVDCDKDKNA